RRYGSVEIDCRRSYRIRKARDIGQVAREREQHDKNQLAIAGTFLDRLNLQLARLELRRFDETLHVRDFQRNPSTPGVHVVGNHCRRLIARSRPSKVCQQAQYFGHARAQRVLRSNGPEQMLHGAEHEEAEEYTDQTIADDGGAGSWAKVLENGFVKCEADLVAAICDAWSAEVHPSSDGSTRAEDKPEPSDRLYVWKQVNQGNETHQTADGGAAKTQDTFLVAGADRRQRHHEAGDD